MADKKLNEVPVVSDIVTIFGKRSNGEIVQIDKSNLATLLGGLIGINDSWLRDNGKTQNLDDLNKVGVYQCGDLTEIGKPSLNDGYGIVLCLSNWANPSQTIGCWTFELMFSTQHNLYTRLRVNEGNWSSWAKITTTAV